MMPIQEFVWPQDRIDHIDRHGVVPAEVEEAFFVRRWCNARSPRARIPSTTFSGKPTPDDRRDVAAAAKRRPKNVAKWKSSSACVCVN